MQSLNRLTMSVPYEGYSKHASCALNWIYTFLFGKSNSKYNNKYKQDGIIQILNLSTYNYSTWGTTVSTDDRYSSKYFLGPQFPGLFLHTYEAEFKGSLRLKKN